MDIGELAARTPAMRERLDAARGAVTETIAWYPYDILGNLTHLDHLITGENRDLERLSGGNPVVDIGAADGDLSFALERECGWTMEIVDNAPTNMNGLRGARALREQLRSSVEIHDIDLDTQFRLPRDHYGLALLLGILYHLQNPFHVLRELSARADHLLLSTRVARFAGPESTPIQDIAVGYLVDPAELNDDPTNYWVFSETGLERLTARAGWTTVDSVSFGDTVSSNTSSMQHDERRFMLLRSTRLSG